MKVTDFNPNGIPIAFSGWSTGTQSIGSNADTLPPLSALNFVQRITANGSNTVLNPLVNFAAGSGITLSASSNTITVTAGSGAGTTFYGPIMANSPNLVTTTGEIVYIPVTTSDGVPVFVQYTA